MSGSVTGRVLVSSGCRCCSYKQVVATLEDESHTEIVLSPGTILIMSLRVHLQRLTAMSHVITMNSEDGAQIINSHTPTDIYSYNTRNQIYPYQSPLTPNS